MRPHLLAAALGAIAALAGISGGCDKEPASGPAVIAGAPAGDVVEVAGAVTAIRDGEPRPLASGDEVSGDDVIETGADGRVVIKLRHNQVPWSLGPGKREQVGKSLAWRAPRAREATGVTDERSGAAGRHAEREAAEGGASALSGAAAAEEAPSAAAPADEPGDEPADESDDMADDDLKAEEEEARDEPAREMAPPPPPMAPRAAPRAATKKLDDDFDGLAPPMADSASVEAKATAIETDLESAVAGLDEGGAPGGAGLGGAGPGGGGGDGTARTSGMSGKGGGGPRGGAPRIAPRPPWSVTVTLADVSGGLDKAIVTRVVRARTSQYVSCGTGKSEVLDTTLTIGTDGKVGSVAIKGGASNTSACVKSRMSALRFPTAKTATTARVRLSYKP